MPTLLQRLRAALAIVKSADLSTLSQVVQGLFPSAQPPARGTKELLDLYRTAPWLRAVTSKIGDAVASVPWRLYIVKGRDGKAVRYRAAQMADAVTRRKLLKELRQDGRLEELEDHQFYRLFEIANPVMTGRQLRKLTQAYLDIKGEAFWLIERNAFGVPVELWPIPPHWVVGTPSADKPWFQVSFPSWQGQIPASEIIWLKDPDLLNPYGRGIGIAESLGDELDTDEFAAQHLKAWFYNRARPDLLVSVEGVQQHELEAIRAKWEAQHRGVLKAFRAHFVNRPMQVTQIGQTFQDQQMVPLREFERNTIMQVFGVPPEIQGVLDNANRATSDVADYIMSKYVVTPRMEFLRAELQMQLVPQFDERIILDYVSPIPEDKEFILNVAKSLQWAFSRNEIRELAGLPPDEKDVIMRPVNMVPYELGEAVTDQNQPGSPEPPPQAEESKGLTEADVETVLEAVKPEYLTDALGTGRGVRRFNDATKAALRDSLLEGLQSGESLPSLVKRVTAVFAEAKGPRAEELVREVAAGQKGADERRLLAAVKRALQRQEHETIRALNALRD